MRGISQSKLCRLRPGASYTDHRAGRPERYAVVKFANSPGGLSNLANECLGSGLARAIGLPTPETVVAHLSEWLSTNSDPREDYMLHGDCLYPPQPGLCFASLMEDPKETHMFDIFPSQFFHRVENLEHFWGAYLLNLWMANNKGCHAVYFRYPPNPRYRVYFVDFGDCWGFGRTHIPPHFSGTEFRCDVIDHIGTAAAEPWLTRISNIGQDQIRQAIGGIPRAWYDKAESREIVRILIDRARNITRLFHEHQSHSSYPFQKEASCGEVPLGDRELRARRGSGDPGVGDLRTL